MPLLTIQCRHGMTGLLTECICNSDGATIVAPSSMWERFCWLLLRFIMLATWYICVCIEILISLPALSWIFSRKHVWLTDVAHNDEVLLFCHNREVESGVADPYSSVVHSGSAQCPKPRWPTRQWRRRTMESQRGTSYWDWLILQQSVDIFYCYRNTNKLFLLFAIYFCILCVASFSHYHLL